MASIENEKIDIIFIFYFNYHLMYFQQKTNSVGITEVSVMAKNIILR